MDAQQLLEVQLKHQDRLLSQANVVSVGIGCRHKEGEHTDESCLVAGVAAKLPAAQLRGRDLVPNNLDGVPVDVFQMGHITADMPRRNPRPNKPAPKPVVESAPEVQLINLKGKHRPAIPGTSIGHKNITTGSFGCVVVDSHGRELILSNNHVLANCFDDQTDVLTDNGFKRWRDVLPDDRLASRTADGELVFDYPEKLHRQFFNGKLIRFKSKCIDQLVTPNHRMLVRRVYKSGLPPYCSERALEFVAAGEILADMRMHSSVSYEFTDRCKWNCRAPEMLELPRVAYLKGKNHNRASVPTAPWLYLLGWYLADGCATKNSASGQKIISIRATRLRERIALAKLVKKVGFHGCVCAGAVVINSKQLYEYLRPLGRAHDKYVPRDIKELHPSLLRFFLAGYLRGDGFHLTAGQVGAVSASSRLIDDVQEIMFKLGMSARVSTIYGSPYNPSGVYYRIDSRKRPCLRLSASPEEVSYSGYVYCATMPLGTLLVRRNGYVVWSGNSNAATLGDAIFQPGPADRGTSADEVGTLLTFVPIVFEGEQPPPPPDDPPGGPPELPDCPVASFAARVANVFAAALLSSKRLKQVHKSALDAHVNYVDAALCLPSVELSHAIDQIGVPNGVVVGEVNMPVQKTGRTTSYKADKILQTHVTVRVNYGGNRIGRFEDQIVAGAMSAGGDSGSAGLDMNGNLFGLLYAGSDQITIFNPIQRVFELLNVRLP